MANLVRIVEFGRFKHYVFSCIDCDTEYIRSVNGKHINPYCADCSRKYQRQRQEEQAKARQRKHDAKVRADAIDEFAELLCKYVYGKDFMSDDVIREIAETVKENKNE